MTNYTFHFVIQGIFNSYNFHDFKSRCLKVVWKNGGLLIDIFLIESQEKGKKAICMYFWGGMRGGGGCVSVIT